VLVDIPQVLTLLGNLEAVWPYRAFFFNQVKRAFRRFAIKRAGASGCILIMPIWPRVIAAGRAGKLFNLQTNLRFGFVTMQHYLDRERGDRFLVLGRYNDSRGRAEYPSAAYAAQRQWQLQPAL
jgi:hypothetical protein